MIIQNDKQFKEQSHNFQVYFEVEDLDKVYTEMKSISDLQWVHEIKEYPWGQRGIRVYDLDMDQQSLLFVFNLLPGGSCQPLVFVLIHNKYISLRRRVDSLFTMA